MNLYASLPLICRSVRVLIPAALTTVALCGCSGWVKREATSLVEAGQTEQALRVLDDGVRRFPEDPTLRARYLQLREDVLDGWLNEASRQRAAGRPDDAERLLNRVQTLDPGNARAADLVRALRTDQRSAATESDARSLATRGQLSAALRTLDEGLRADPRHAGMQALRLSVLTQQRAQQVKAAQLGLAEQRPISLDFRDAGLRQVLDLVTRHSGLNFVLDKDIRQDLRVTVYLRQVRVEDALDLIVSTHQLARKVLDERTVLLYPNTPEKQREYQEQVIRVFYLASAEAKGAAAFLRSMLKVKEPFVDERSNMLALREPPDMVALAERLIGLYDTPDPEVLLELEVLEVRSTRLTELGVRVPSSVSLTPLAPTTGGALTISNLRGLGDDRIGVSIGGVTLNLRREVGDFEILANPRVRARNREKAKVLIGDKVPIITTTTGQLGFVSDTVSYIDVGLKLDIEPTVYANDEVAIRLALEVGTLAGQTKTNSGTVAYQISTRNASTALRLRDGETQLLAGLLSKEERTSASRVPLAGDVPVLGRLFSSQLDDGSRTELVLAITPRILRNARPPDASESELWVGTEAYTRLRQVGGRVASESVQPIAAAPAPPAAATVGAAEPAAASTVPTREGAMPQTAGSQVVLRWGASPSARAGQPFVVALDGELGVALRGLNMELQLSPGDLTLLDAAAGSLWKEGGSQASHSASLDASSGLMDAGVVRSDRTTVQGAGRLAEWRFMAPRAGRFELTLRRATANGPAAAAAATVLPGTLVIEVQP